MITDYGMSDKFKNVALTKRSSGFVGSQQATDPFASKEYSEETQRYIEWKQLLRLSMSAIDAFFRCSLKKGASR